MREEAVFRQVLRAQLPTHKHGPDPFYAMMQDSGEGPEVSVFVKGPYAYPKYAHIQKLMDVVKGVLEEGEADVVLHPLDVRVLSLVPCMDLLPGGRGYSGDASNEATYVVMRDLVGYQNCSTKRMSSKRFDNIEVLDKDSADVQPISIEALKTSERARLGVLCALAFRYMMEINDTCNGNLLIERSSGRVWSVDENNAMVGVRPWLFKKKSPKVWRALLLEAVEGAEGNAMRERLARWETRLRAQRLFARQERAIQHTVALRDLQLWRNKL